MGKMHRASAGDRGSVSAEFVIIAPLVMLMLWLIMQFAVWALAAFVAQAAAAQGLAAARVQDGTVAAGSDQAQHLLDQLASGPLTNGHIVVNRSATTASVEITGQAIAVVPFMHLPVRAEASGPVEQWTSSNGGE